MHKNKILEKYKPKLISIIQTHIPKCKIYLFGSRARKDHQEGSDIDIALDIGKPIDIKTICVIYNEIEETNLPLFIDLVDLHTATDDLKNEVKKDLKL